MQFVAGAAVPILLLASTCLSAPASFGGALTWQPCPTWLVPSNLTIQCGHMEVPMDWDHPDDEKKVNLGMVKLPARDPANRIGYLFYNPGGPGDQASLTLVGVVEGMSRIHEEVLDKFDIIGIDLRGTGLSDPIACDNHIFNNGPAPWYPSTVDSFEERQNSNIAFRKSCIQMTGSLINYMDTVSIAKDFEAVRQALNEDNLSWVVTSYGTQLGTQYAELFPDNIRAMVLDGCVSLSPSETSLYATGAADSDVVLKSFFNWCEQQSSSLCPLSHRNQTAEDIWIDLMDRSDRHPIPAPVCEMAETACVKSTLNANDIRSRIYTYLYDRINFPAIGVILAEAAFHNNASGLYTPAITDDDTPYYSSSSYGEYVISCSDRVADHTPAYETFKGLFASSETPLMFGYSASSQFQRSCIGWPAPKRNPPHEINIPETPKMHRIFMTNNLYDPATPYAGAVNLQQEIGDRAVLVTRNATGHSMFLKPDAYQGATMNALVKYLLTGEVPELGTFFQN